MSELLSVLMAVLIAVMAIPKVAAWQAISQENKLIAITAQEEKQFDTAVSAYVQQNSTPIQAVATATVPATITVAMLQATNMLTTAFSPTNPYGQSWQAQVLQPSAGNLQVLAYSTGGQTLSDTQINKISMLVPSGGFIPSNDGGAYPTAANNAIGARASWNVPTAGYTGIAGGHVAALFSVNQGQLMNSYLYRNAVPGQPQLNTMNTPLVMASVQTAGQACALGSIARDAAGGLLACPGASLQWSSVANSACTAANFASLPTTGNTLGKLCVTTDNQRAYGWNNASWVAIAIDSAGNFTLPGSLYTSGSALSTYGAASVQGSKNGWSGLNFKDVAGSNSGTLMMHPAYSGFFNAADNNWRWLATDNGETYTRPGGANGSIAIGNACPGTGYSGIDASGLSLSCQSGVWKSAGGTLATSYSASTFAVGYRNGTARICGSITGPSVTNSITGGLSCPAGTAATVSGNWAAGCAGQVLYACR